MIIYLLRHAIAVEHGTVADPHDARPLTDDGKEKMAQAAKGIAKLVGSIDIIVTSPLVRALDTAKIVAKALGSDTKIEVCRSLAPGGVLKNTLLHLTKFKGLSSMMIVGHQPDLGYLASTFLGSDPSIIEFKKGALCAIEIAGLSSREKGKLLWHLQPKHLRAIA